MGFAVIRRQKLKPNTCLVIDTWEGQLEIDEAVLKANGVSGVSVRLNNMSGGHHMDAGFAKQWYEARGFIRFPYFVYNPWVDGAANFAWLKANMPLDAQSVAIDIEVKWEGYAPNKYAGEVVKFLELCKPHWKTIIYTAEWFLYRLSSWPKVDYWWAQYPDQTYYFGQVKTWDDLKTALDKLDKPFNASKIPGTLKMWQFSGDYLTLPGNTRKMDVNVFYGPENELADYFGAAVATPKPDPDPDPDPEPEPYIAMKSVKIGGTLVPGLLEVAFTVNGESSIQVIDQRPSTPPPPKPSSNLYRVASEKWPVTHWPLTIPWGGGPLTQTLSHTTKKAYEETPLDAKWQAYIRRFNSEVSWKQIAAKDYGPSKGINGNGLLRYIGLVWPSNSVTNNLVKVLELSGEWARIDSIAIDGSRDLSQVNPVLTPWLFHLVCDNKGNPVTRRIVCPILGGPWWVPRIALVLV